MQLNRGCSGGFPSTNEWEGTMDPVEFRVRPVAAGWILETSASLAPLAFRAGGAAERKADALAQAMTAAGVDAKVVVLDRAGQVAGVRWYWAAEPDMALA